MKFKYSRLKIAEEIQNIINRIIDNRDFDTSMMTAIMNDLLSKQEEPKKCKRCSNTGMIGLPDDIVECPVCSSTPKKEIEEDSLPIRTPEQVKKSIGELVKLSKEYAETEKEIGEIEIPYSMSFPNDITYKWAKEITKAVNLLKKQSKI